jgi:hypothetical protein
MSAILSLLEAKRTWRGHREMSGDDPKGEVAPPPGS